MRKLIVGTLVGVFVMGLYVADALAIHCLALVQECEALIAKLENSPKADKQQVAQAKQGCEDAKHLHEDGNHADSVIRVGEAIALAGKSIK